MMQIPCVIVGIEKMVISMCEINWYVLINLASCAFLETNQIIILVLLMCMEFVCLFNWPFYVDCGDTSCVLLGPGTKRMPKSGS